jgi:Cupin
MHPIFQNFSYETKLKRSRRHQMTVTAVGSERKDAIMDEDIENKRKRKEDSPNRETASAHSGHPMDRRSFLTRSTLVAGGVLASPLILASNGEPAPAQSTSTDEKETIMLPDFRFPLTQQPARELPGGSAREATAREFPVSKNIAGVLMTLKAGGLRELHWHANADEWQYVL